LSCLPHGRSSTATMCQQATDCLTHTGLKHSNKMCQQATLELPPHGRKHSNRLCTSKATLSCLTGRSSTATMCQQATLELPHAVAQAQQQAMYQQAGPCPPHTGRSSDKTGYKTNTLSTGQLKQQQAMYQQSFWSCLTQSLKHSNRLCTSRLPDCLTGRSSTATGYVPAGYLGLTASHVEAQQQAMCHRLP
jgi:hypothetical protein